MSAAQPRKQLLSDSPLHSPGRPSGIRVLAPEAAAARWSADPTARLRHLQQQLADTEESLRQLQGELHARDYEILLLRQRLSEVDSERAGRAVARSGAPQPSVPPPLPALAGTPSSGPPPLPALDMANQLGPSVQAMQTDAVIRVITEWPIREHAEPTQQEQELSESNQVELLRSGPLPPALTVRSAESPPEVTEPEEEEWEEIDPYEAELLETDPPPTPSPPEPAGTAMEEAGRKAVQHTAPDVNAWEEIDASEAELLPPSPAPPMVELATGPATLTPGAARPDPARSDACERPSLRSATLTTERRQHERLPVTREVEFTADTEFYAGISQDLSRGGVFVATYQPLPVGTPVKLCLELTDAERIELQGEVRWLRDGDLDETRPGMGVAFLGLSAAVLAVIDGFCASRPPLLYE